MVYNRILLNTEQLQAIVSGVAKQVNNAYEAGDDCLALVILEGARYFAGDLLGQLDFSIEVEFMKASSYLGGTQSSGTVDLHSKDSLEEKINGRNVLIIDDIYDTGHTLAKLLKWVKDCGAAEVKTCVLLEKEIGHAETIAVDFLGTTVEDVFVIGYGLDYNHQYRELPFIAELAEEHSYESSPDGDVATEDDND